MITASEVKNYLRIDYTDDDVFIAAAIQSGYDYLADAIDDYAEMYSGNPTFAAKCDMWVLTQWMPSMYDPREGMFVSGGPAMNYMARAMLTQLQMYVVGDNPEPGPEPDPEPPGDNQSENENEGE